MNNLLKFIDVTSIFKDKKFGDLKRWSAKRTIGGAIVIYALNTMGESISWQGVVLCDIGIVPLCLSRFECRKCDKKCNV